MYLKSIEMQGFKSFADRTLMEFREGITGIVGPNGSGKSNIADAVRWVLGEQSAKQLRGGNMQDVIFSGTQSRKPLGFAAVTITLDNADKKLAIDYDTVAVTRRLFRSGESEYLMNGHACRLRDIQELFYDTGIGKEGYSIIGQGQIDRIVSGKPEERRELLDEAAGIVKYKRRKAATIKKLDSEEQNLARITDILSELTRQLGPLSRQAEKAKIYLGKRDELKENELSLFCLDEDRLNKAITETSEKLVIAKDELEAAGEALAKTREEYERIEAEIRTVEERILSIRNTSAESAVKKQELAGQQEVLREQIKSSAANKGIYRDRLTALEAELERKTAAKNALADELAAAEESLAAIRKDLEQQAAERDLLLSDIAEKNDSNEEANSRLMALFTDRTKLLSEDSRFKTLKEQLAVQDAAFAEREKQLAGRLSEAQAEDARCAAAYKEAADEAEDKRKALAAAEDELAALKAALETVGRENDRTVEEYHRDKSLLESLTGLAEKYEGYGSAVRKILEQMDSNPDIAGVVAELISTEGKYETAIETALGGTLQNVVTDNESTAKYLIEYLKRGRFGRVTFLPLSVIKGSSREKPIKEKGFIGIASDLVECEKIYRPLAERLLGRTFVIDNIDNAIAIGRKYGHKYRMVTLEGELISAGGSMTGGAYRNNANLMGRKRQIEELTEKVEEDRKTIAAQEEKIASIKNTRYGVRDRIAQLNEVIGELSIKENTLRVQFEMAEKQAEQISNEAEDIRRQRGELAGQVSTIEGSKETLAGKLSGLDRDEEALKTALLESGKTLEGLAAKEKEMAGALEQLKVSEAAAGQQAGYLGRSMDSADAEIALTKEEMESILRHMEEDEEETAQKEKDIEALQAAVAGFELQMEELTVQLETETANLDALKASHSGFFNRREELSGQMSLMDKECFRLESTLERLENERTAAVEHLWEEYALTPITIVRPELKSSDRAGFVKNVKRLKAEIKELGSVNVNAIEEYKEVSERHAFLSGQYDDIVKAEDALKKIIADLNTGMRKQFSEQFADIRHAFSLAFRSLFGGGKADLELVEGEDLLEAGVRIIAQPPGKKLQNMMQLSGGEKALTAIALLFAIQNLKPSPFCLLDEIEAALDEPNVARFATFLHKLTENTQFIVITHRRGTMTEADRLYGITMQEKGISGMVSVDLIEAGLDD